MSDPTTIADLATCDCRELLDEIGPLLAEIGPEAAQMRDEAVSGDPATCWQELLGWITTGRLDDVWRENPKKVIGTILCILGDQLSALAAYLTGSDVVPVIGSATSPLADSAASIRGQIYGQQMVASQSPPAPLGALEWVTLLKIVLPLLLRLLRRRLAEYTA